MQRELIDKNPANYIVVADFSTLCAMPKTDDCDDEDIDDGPMMCLTDLDKLCKSCLEKQYSIFSYAVRASRYSGLRAGEIPGLKWNDVKGDDLIVRRQQLKHKDKKTNKEYFEIVPWTKNTKKSKKKSRRVPIVPKLREVFEEVRAYQIKAGIYDDYGFIFCNPDGQMCLKDSYEQFLRRECEALEIPVHNNHAIRKSYNSLILIPAGLNSAERAQILGHSIEVNEKYYSLSGRDAYNSCKKKLGL